MSHSVINFAIAIAQFVFAATIAGLVATVFDTISVSETTTVIMFVVLFVLLLFIAHRVTKRI